MIIDGHAHTYPDQVAAKVLDTFTSFHHMEPTTSLGTGTVDDLTNRMQDAGIAYTVTANFAPEKSIRRTNEWSLKMAKEHPCLIPLVAVCPGMTLDEIKRYFDNGAKGIKMHNGIQGFDPSAPGLTMIYRYCQENRIPITFHCGETSRVHMNEYTNINHITPVVAGYPGIPFILTHLAAGEPDVLLEIAEKYPNAVFDTSITFTGERCIYRIHNDVWEDDEKSTELFRKVGCARISFGSDYPLGNQKSDIKRFMRLKLNDEERNLILGKNLQEIYRIKA